eukprot:m.239885 g.239885  ORF g.239885 m.239885 type:complete len:750 (+) comp13564_c0_seq1:11-2260(+)
MAEPFIFRAYLLGHTSDVRSVCWTHDGRVVTGSRDMTAKLWSAMDDNIYLCDNTFSGHSRYIMSVAYAPPSEHFPNGRIATGSLDGTALIFDPLVPEPLQKLEGHTNAVCSVAFASAGHVVTSSWDATARIWDGPQCLTTLQGHEKSVLCATPVAIAGTPGVVTGSADQTVRAWTPDGACVQVLRGHTDAVRQLLQLSDTDVVSCANDGTLRIWSVSAGVCITTIDAHSAYIYSICLLPNGDLVSSAEDGQVKVWQGSECVQVLKQPCLSVWCVAASPNGDLAIGGNDGAARLYTRDPARAAESAALQAFEAELQAAVAARESGKLGDLSTENLPSRSALAQPGKSEGDPLLVRHGGKVEAYQWVGGTWVFTGEVTDAVDNKKETPFTIELDGRKYTLRHPHDQNPYVTAQKFIYENDLDQSFLEEIARFVEANTTAPTLTTAMPVNVDPFTSRGAYRPTANAAQSAPAGQYRDPFTGKNAYTTPAAVQLLVNRQPLTFDAALNVPALAKKLAEYTDTPAAALSASDQAMLGALGGLGDSGDDALAAVGAIVARLATLPPARRLPGLDAARLVVLHARARDHLYAALGGNIEPLLFECRGAQPDPAYAVSVRVLTNLVAQGALAPLARARALQAVDWPAAWAHKASALSIATLAVNLATQFAAAPDPDAAPDELECLRAVSIGLTSGIDLEAETTYRLTVALSTLMGAGNTLRDAARTIDGLRARVQTLSTHLDARIASIAGNLTRALT